MLNVLTPNRPNDLDVVKLAQVKGFMGNHNWNAAIAISSVSWKIKNFVARRLAKEYVEKVQKEENKELFI